MELRVLELYSGIGGMHYAVQASGLPNYKVVAAVDISPLANAVYRHNFPETLHIEKGIEGLKVNYLDSLNFNVLMMSPPCQPFTRVGLKKDLNDPRSKSFIYLMETLPKLKSPPSFILLENVKGFDESEAFKFLCETLQKLDYSSQSFLISPKKIKIPNSRLRFYFLARRKPFKFTEKWCKFDQILTSFPSLNKDGLLPNNAVTIDDVTMAEDECFPISDYLEEVGNGFEVPVSILDRYLSVMDVVTPHCTSSTCFTKSYGKYAEGTGSILRIEDKKFRYFSSREIANLMGFPKNFEFGENFDVRKKYRLLGNSLNVKVVAHLFKLLVGGD